MDRPIADALPARAQSSRHATTRRVRCDRIRSTSRRLSMGEAYSTGLGFVCKSGPEAKYQNRPLLIYPFGVSPSTKPRFWIAGFRIFLAALLGARRAIRFVSTIISAHIRAIRYYRCARTGRADKAGARFTTWRRFCHRAAWGGSRVPSSRRFCDLEESVGSIVPSLRRFCDRAAAEGFPPVAWRSLCDRAASSFCRHGSWRRNFDRERRLSRAYQMHGAYARALPLPVAQSTRVPPLRVWLKRGTS